jgi:enamine deaminase RidA (YjgF/YER057c/UK114 family)/mono/diheme cytochrome c family protein
MSQAVATQERTALQTLRVCDREAVIVDTAHAREVYARGAPESAGATRTRQARELYHALARLLRKAGADLDNVVTEKVFFRDIAADFEIFQKVRSEVYDTASIAEEERPATTYLEQPPCQSGNAFELQAYALVPRDAERVRVRSLEASGCHSVVKLVELGDYRHLYISNIVGWGHDGAEDSFRAQSDAMFANADELLRRHGGSFQHVLRTWIHLAEIDRDYTELNASRNAFFHAEGIRRLPASTGIAGKPFPRSRHCCLDLYALLNPEGATIEVMHTPTLNEAADYGSKFSRGMKLVLPDKTVLFISGTASVNEHGRTEHVGDVRLQMHRMLLNVEELLRPHGATFHNIVQVLTYLKSASDLDLFHEVCAERRLGYFPNTIVEAGVCRPDLLCEMEAIAVLPAEESCPARTLPKSTFYPAERPFPISHTPARPAEAPAAVPTAERWEPNNPRRRSARTMWTMASVAVFALLALGAGTFWLRRSPMESPAAVRGAEVAQRMGCFGCHGPAGSNPIADPAAPAGHVPSWQGGATAFNDERQLREWIMKAPQYGAPGARLVAMPGYQGRLSEQELEELVAYFRAVSGWAPEIPGDAAQGRNIATRLGCFGCHGPSGMGGVPNPGSSRGYMPAWHGQEFNERTSNAEQLRKWIMDGQTLGTSAEATAHGPPTVPVIHMPSYGKYLTDDEYRKLAAYMNWQKSR